MQTLDTLLETFYEDLITSLSSQSSKGGGDNTTAGGATTFFQNGNASAVGVGVKGKIASMNRATDSEVRRTIERLLLRLDFNNGFSKAGRAEKSKMNNILGEGGLL